MIKFSDERLEGIEDELFHIGETLKSMLGLMEYKMKQSK